MGKINNNMGIIPTILIFNTIKHENYLYYKKKQIK